MSCGVLLCVYPVWDSLGFLDWGDSFLPHFREVLSYYLLKYLLMPSLFVFFWDSYDSNVGAFEIVPEVSEVVLISFSFFFFFFPLSFIYFHHSIFHLTYPVFCLRYSTVGSLQSGLISVIALFIIDWLFFFYFFEVLVKLFLHLLNPCLQTIYL